VIVHVKPGFNVKLHTVIFFSTETQHSVETPREKHQKGHATYAKKEPMQIGATAPIFFQFPRPSKA
jgi:hypothetical protein